MHVWHMSKFQIIFLHIAI